MFFELFHTDPSGARAGVMRTSHGDIETPVFMPVGTQATVKSLDSSDLEGLDAQIILGNTYHLHLRPGEDLIASFGGLHTFMRWDKPILTDSGGFQVFSLGNTKTETDAQGKLVSIDEDGVTFRSHIDGSTHRFTPEIAMDIQKKIGADIVMAFDECTGDDVVESYARDAMERTHRWAERSLAEHRKATHGNAYRQYIFGIIQGARFRHLREESARAISGMDFDGIAIGGESIGFNMEKTKEILSWITPLLPADKPRYTMGVGAGPLDLFEVVERGIDMFDCVAPTRMARTGALFVHDAARRFRLNIENAEYAKDKEPIDGTCECPTCRTYSRAYLHHLFAAHELLAYRLATIHNLHFFLGLCRDMRRAILEDRFAEFKRSWIEIGENRK